MGAFEGLGEALAMLRHQRGFGQQEVAERAGITRAQLAAYEVGRTRPGFTNLSKILQGLGFDRFKLLDALQTVNGRPSVAVLPTRSQASPKDRELLDLLDLDLDPAAETAFLGMLERLKSWYLDEARGEDKEGSSPPADDLLPGS